MMVVERVPHEPSRPGLPCSTTRIIEIGTAHWCWSHLLSTREGVLRFPDPDGRSLAVSYVVSRDQVHVAQSTGGLRSWIPEGEVTLEVTGSDPADGRWLVRATGRALPAYGEPAGAMVLPAVRVRGHHELDVLEETG